MERTKTPAFFGDELPQDRKLRLGGERLLDAVAELPLRYAPFFGRLAGLWGISEDHVLHELTRAKDPRSWTYTLLRGLRTFKVDVGAAAPARRARLMRFAPGTHFPKHAHRGPERVLVLEGAYADSNGVEARAGDMQSMAEGSEHELHILGTSACVAAIVEDGIEFTGPVLRWATKLLG